MTPVMTPPKELPFDLLPLRPAWWQRLLRALGFHVHTWSKWEYAGHVQSTIHKGIIGRTQIRTCTECGKMDVQRRYLV